MFRLWLTGIVAAWCAPAFAAGLDDLEAFLKTVRSGRAEFTQSVTGPTRDGQPSRVRNSTGTFAFSRPDRFRFQYTRPFEQVIVADGQTLWLYDVDLNQVTAQQQAQALGSTPAGLLAAAPDLTALQKEFTLRSGPERDGLQWVLATPRATDAQLREVRVGFRAGALAALEILDSFGQRSVIQFQRLDTSASLPADTFQFKVPAGADVIRR